MNILISVDQNYLEKESTMMFSLHKNTAENVVVYFMNHSLTAKEISAFRKCLRKNGIFELHEIQVLETVFDSCSLGNSHFSIEMYYRLIAQWFLPEELDRILWLDADIIVQKDLAAFYHQNFHNAYMVACADAKSNSVGVQKIKQKLMLSDEHIYFNSGVLLLNLNKLRQSTTLEQITSCAVRMNERLTFPDQDLLNVLYTGKVQYADWKIYNYQIGTLDHANAVDQQQAAVIHYTGMWKPWNYKCINKQAAPYWNYQVQQGKLVETILAYTKHAIYCNARNIKRKTEKK